MFGEWFCITKYLCCISRKNGTRHIYRVSLSVCVDVWTRTVTRIKIIYYIYVYPKTLLYIQLKTHGSDSDTVSFVVHAVLTSMMCALHPGQNGERKKNEKHNENQTNLISFPSPCNCMCARPLPHNIARIWHNSCICLTDSSCDMVHQIECCSNVWKVKAMCFFFYFFFFRVLCLALVVGLFFLMWEMLMFTSFAKKQQANCEHYYILVLFVFLPSTLGYAMCNVLSLLSLLLVVRVLENCFSLLQQG